MSGRRKRAPPVRADEERRQQHCWNMHEDRRNEPLTLTDDEELPCLGLHSPSAHSIILDDDLKDELSPRNKKRFLEAESISNSVDKEDTGGLSTPLSIKLNIVISPYHFDNSWKALLGELTLQLLPEQSLIENFSERSFTLTNLESSNQFLIYIHSKYKDVEKQKKPCLCDKGIRVKSSFSDEMFEDLGWLQKKRRIKLYQKPEGNHIIKVFNFCGVFSESSAWGSPFQS